MHCLEIQNSMAEKVCKIINRAELSKGIKEQIWNTWYGFRIQVSAQLKRTLFNNINQRGLDHF